MSGRWMDVPAERLMGDHNFFDASGRPNASGWLQIALESLPYRLMMYPTDTSALDFYVALLALGGYEDGAQSGQAQETTMNSSQGGPLSNAVAQQEVEIDALRLWVDTGVTEKGAPEPAEDLAGTAAGDIEERLAAVRSYLEAATEIVDRLYEDSLRDNEVPEAESLPEQELAPYLLGAIKQVEGMLARRHRPQQGGGRGQRVGI